MAFVGNGFDIQILADYNSRIDSRYEHFYRFLERRHFDPQNALFAEMKSLRSRGAEDWSDVEAALDGLLRSGALAPQKLLRALQDIQGQFSEFLDLVAPSSLLAEIGLDSMRGDRSLTSVAEFLGDLDGIDLQSSEFRSLTQNRDFFNFYFVNLNYTPLLDNYVYLDQKQFDPLPNSSVDRNFTFKADPRDLAPIRGWTQEYSSYLETTVIHPHGHQSVPRSILFGTDVPNGGYGNSDPRLRLAKPFWAQDELRYGHLFEDTELYLIFGCSMGASDRWWWKRIADSLASRRSRPGHAGEAFQPELIIFWWYPDGAPAPSKDSVRDHFFRAAGVTPSDEQTRRTYVICYTPSTPRVWLNTARTD